MRETRTYGSVRGAPSNGRPYRDTTSGNITDDVITAYLERHTAPHNQASAFRPEPTGLGR
jgi:hypothetical protein